MPPTSNSITQSGGPNTKFTLIVHGKAFTSDDLSFDVVRDIDVHFTSHLKLRKRRNAILNGDSAPGLC
jgi:hypothetical protein